MLDHQGQMSIPAIAVRVPVNASEVVSYSLAYNAMHIMDNENLASALLARKSSVEPIVLAK